MENKCITIRGRKYELTYHQDNSAPCSKCAFWDSWNVKCRFPKNRRRGCRIDIGTHKGLDTYEYQEIPNEQVCTNKNKKVLIAVIVSVILYVCTILTMIKALGLEEGLIKGIFSIFFAIPATFYGLFISKENEDTGVLNPLPCIKFFIICEIILSVTFLLFS